MDLVILSPDRELYTGQASSIQLPGLNGRFEVLDNHAPIVAGLGAGEVRVKTPEGKSLFYTIDKGFLEVLNNEATLLVQGVTSHSKDAD